MTMTDHIRLLAADLTHCSTEVAISHVLAELAECGAWCSTPRKETPSGVEWDDEQWSTIKLVERVVAEVL